ncbi:MAG: adenosylmethionine--8-amino-7-oxononanoate transaminase, partial [Candidatus Hydrogenedentes bacterium]|nr:adenosylmethionine--8-amino-7-oxononanoate transaminase [Candidatus Hydrogenedentota bacterium]
MIPNQQQLDYRHLWHPYTDTNRYEQAPYRSIERAEGVYLIDSEGKRYLDGISSWWALNLGHGHPRLIQAIQDQAAALQHCIIGNLAHPPAVELAARIAQMAPGDLNHSYFASDGSSAVEAALKIAIQYWLNRGVSGRNQFLGLELGYHGDTLGTIAVGFVPQYHGPFEHMLRPALRAPVPLGFSEAEEEAALAEAVPKLEALFEEHGTHLAAVVVEPLVQGAAGMRIYPPAYLRRISELCDEHNVLLIADEIAVGFGRTGKLWACDHAEVVPDILCLGKGLTGGYLPMSAAVVTTEIYDSFRNDAGETDKTFYDGHTFCGNPLTSALAVAALEVYEHEHVVDRTLEKSSRLAKGMAGLADHPAIEGFKCLGMVGMCSVRNDAGGAAFARRVTDRAMREGLYLRPLGRVLYLWPPLVSTEGELDAMIRL